SDFSPLVSKLRENDKTVIGVGVKQSTSDLLIGCCDEFIYYDDLVRERKKPAAKKARAAKAPAEGEPAPKKSDEERRQQALDLVIETIEALQSERGGDEAVWSSMVKQALKRRDPGFNESFYGYRSFGALLEDAKRESLVDLVRDDKSGNYRVRLLIPED
ncbi:MAG TPA: NYN domain-containing protein, partial [Casimicrobiaceae bacterium]